MFKIFQKKSRKPDQLLVKYRNSNNALVFALDGLISFVENSSFEAVRKTDLSEMADNLAEFYLKTNNFCPKRVYTMNQPTRKPRKTGRISLAEYLKIEA